MKPIIRIVALSLGVAVIGLGSGARADQQGEGAHPCAADAERLCKGVPMGHGAQMQCLKAHKTELSPACKDKVLKAAERHEEQQMQKQEQPAPMENQPPAQ